MIPEDVGRRFGAELYSASEIYGAAFINVKVRSAKYGSRWHCQQKSQGSQSRQSRKKIEQNKEKRAWDEENLKNVVKQTQRRKRERDRMT